MIVNNQRILEIIEEQRILMQQRDKNIISLYEFNKKYNNLEFEKNKIQHIEINKEQERIKKLIKEQKEKRKNWKQELYKQELEKFNLNNNIKLNKEVNVSKQVVNIKHRQQTLGEIGMVTNIKNDRSDVKMADVKPVEVKKEKVIKQPKQKTLSVRSAILNALMLKTINTHEKVVAKVLESFPTENKDKILKYSKYVVSCLKKNDKRFSKYNWDDTNFLVTLKQ